MYHVSTLTILAIIFTMFVSIGGPVFLCFLIVKKFHAKLYPAVIGAAAFAFFVLVLESVNLIYYGPVLLAAGVITGLLIGVVSAEVKKRVPGIIK